MIVNEEVVQHVHVLGEFDEKFLKFLTFDCRVWYLGESEHNVKHC